MTNEEMSEGFRMMNEEQIKAMQEQMLIPIDIN